MYGLINNALKKVMLIDEHGAQCWDQILDKIGVEKNEFINMDQYPDSITYDLIKETSSFNFSDEKIYNALPFHLIINREMLILSCGAFIDKVWQPKGKKIQEIFEFTGNDQKKSKEISFNNICNSTVKLVCKNKKISLRAKSVELDKDTIFVDILRMEQKNLDNF